MATFALRGSTILRENKYRAVMAVNDEMAWRERSRNREL